VRPRGKILLFHFELFSQLDDLVSVGLPRANTHHFPHGPFAKHDATIASITGTVPANDRHTGGM
jgi:hypothetical protein